MKQTSVRSAASMVAKLTAVASKKAMATADKKVVQEALQTTWVLNGILKRAQLTYLYIGKLLNEVREKKMWQALGHPDIEDYAEKRLHLRRSSLYRYLQVFDWVTENHPEWLQPKPQGFIPDLSDAADLMWIENELQRKDLSAEKRAALEVLRDKALNGELRDGELSRFRKKKHDPVDGLKSFLGKLRLLRRQGAQLTKMPPEVLAHLDSAIGILTNDLPLTAFRYFS